MFWFSVAMLQKIYETAKCAKQLLFKMFGGQDFFLVAINTLVIKIYIYIFNFLLIKKGGKRYKAFLK